jgi:hypothetical protein
MEDMAEHKMGSLLEGSMNGIVEGRDIAEGIMEMVEDTAEDIVEYIAEDIVEYIAEDLA